MWLSQVWHWSFGLYIYIIKFKPSFFNRLEDQADTTRLLRIRLLIDNIFMKIIIIMTITHQWATWTRRWGEFWQSWRILAWLQILWWAPPYQHCKTMPFFHHHHHNCHFHNIFRLPFLEITGSSLESMESMPSGTTLKSLTGLMMMTMVIIINVLNIRYIWLKRRVPLLIAVPGASGQHRDGLVELVDLFPTVINDDK